MTVKYVYLSLFTFVISGFLFVSFPQQSNFRLMKLTEKSDVILTGKVVKQKSSWNANKTRIYTEATLQVDEYLKGNNKGNSVIVTYPGGEVGSVGELYSHMPRFSNDEDVLVFLKKDEREVGYKVYDGENGEIKIYTDPKTGEKVTSSSVRINYLKTKIKSFLKNVNKN